MNEGFFWHIFTQDANAAKRHGPDPKRVHRLHYLTPDKGTSAGYVEQQYPADLIDLTAGPTFTITSNERMDVREVPVASLVDGMNKIEWLTYEARNQKEKQA